MFTSLLIAAGRAEEILLVERMVEFLAVDKRSAAIGWAQTGKPLIWPLAELKNVRVSLMNWSDSSIYFVPNNRIKKASPEIRAK